jgi:hypothetical protein
VLAFKAYVALAIAITTTYASVDRTEAQQQQAGTEEATTVDLGTVVDAARATRPPLDLRALARTDAKGQCAIHNEAMRPAHVPILVGLQPGAVWTRHDEWRHHPNGATHVDGGCGVVGPKVALVLQCQRCIAHRTTLVANGSRHVRSGRQARPN